MHFALQILVVVVLLATPFSAANSQTCGHAVPNQKTIITGEIRVNGIPTQGVQIQVCVGAVTPEGTCPHSSTVMSDGGGKFSFVEVGGYSPGTFLGACDPAFSYSLRATHLGKTLGPWHSAIGAWAPEEVVLDCELSLQLDCKVRDMKFSGD
jgi:hypothetical protein